jgi:hypothetical protein
MNFKAVDDRICSLRMRGKSNKFTITSVPAPMEEKDKPVKDSLYNKPNQIYQRIQAHYTKL